MRSTLRSLLGVAFSLALSGAALAVGNPPLPNAGPALPDSQWLNGLANGQNASYQYGITALGTTQATATQLPAGVALLEIDTAAASTGVNLPPALPGTEISVYNNGAHTITVYPAVANNPVTAVQDTINGGTTLSGGIAANATNYFFCVKAGNWAAK